MPATACLNTTTISSTSASARHTMIIQEFDLQIAELEQTLLDVKRRRNAHLPVHRLPPEILGEIFSFTSGVYDSWAERQKASHPPVLPIPVLLCHVCHYWRESVLQNSGLWTNIHFGFETPKEMAEFISENAANAPLHVRLDERLDRPVAHRGKALLSNTSRLLSVNLTVHFNSDAKLLLRLATGRAERLECLRISIKYDKNHLPVPPFEGGVPGLRDLMLHNFSVRWKSHLLQSPNLKHLTMLPAFSPDVEPLQGFYDFLRRTPQLETLHLAFPLDEPGMDPIPTTFLSDTESSLIPLSDLGSLDISASLDTFCAVLGRIQISTKHISHLGLNLFVSEGGETATDILQFLTAWRRATGGSNSQDRRDTISAPECIRLSKTQSSDLADIWTCGYTIQAWDSRSQNILLSTLMTLRYRAKTGLGYPPWAKIKIQCQDERFFGDHPNEGFPFPYYDTFADSGLLSLDNLRFVMINVSLPSSYWAAFSLLKFLEVIHVAAASTNGFVGVLDADPPQPNNPTTTAITTAGEPTRLPFPALRSFVITSMANYDSADTEILLAQLVVGALQKRCHALLLSGDAVQTCPKLDLLEFNCCRTKIEEDTHSQMFTIATTVVWNKG